MSNQRFFSALILDCDGVIVDSEPFSCGAWNVVFRNEYGIDDIGDEYAPILGKNSRDAATYYLEKCGLEASEPVIQRLSKLKEQAYFELAKNNLKTVDGVENVIEQARKKGWKVGVASSGTITKIEFNLEQVELLHSFDAIAESREGLRGKPFPDIFLDGARKLDKSPEECIVIEDTPSGIKAAKDAGMFVIGISTTFPRTSLTEADLVVSIFQDVDLDSIA